MSKVLVGKTKIHSNGSKWAGEENCTIEELIDVLKHHDLDLERFACHGFISFKENNGYPNRDYEKHNVHVWGNFVTISHVFNIDGVYENLLPLIQAIEANIKDQCSRIKDVK